jgi:hypothetical protein
MQNLFWLLSFQTSVTCVLLESRSKWWRFTLQTSRGNIQAYHDVQCFGNYAGWQVFRLNNNKHFQNYSRLNLITSLVSISRCLGLYTWVFFADFFCFLSSYNWFHLLLPLMISKIISALFLTKFIFSPQQINTLIISATKQNDVNKTLLQSKSWAKQQRCSCESSNKKQWGSMCCSQNTPRVPGLHFITGLHPAGQNIYFAVTECTDLNL